MAAINKQTESRRKNKNVSNVSCHVRNSATEQHAMLCKINFFYYGQVLVNKHAKILYMSLTNDQFRVNPCLYFLSPPYMLNKIGFMMFWRNVILFVEQFRCLNFLLVFLFQNKFLLNFFYFETFFLLYYVNSFNLDNIWIDRI